MKQLTFSSDDGNRESDYWLICSPTLARGFPVSVVVFNHLTSAHKTDGFVEILDEMMLKINKIQHNLVEPFKLQHLCTSFSKL